MWSSDSVSSDEEVVVRRQKLFKARINYAHTETSYEFNERFRLTANKLETLINLLGPILQRNTNRNHALSVKMQLQIALHWLGTSVQFHAVGDMHGVCKASVCRVVHNVVNGVVDIMFPQFVQWPTNMPSIVEQFFKLGGFPMVCGCIDGTLIKIDAPKENEEQFVDRHGNHSINCMVVCGPDLKFYYSYANWPGQTHDARVLRRSGLFNRMERGWRPIPNGIILGDSGYPLKKWLIPPIMTGINDNANLRFLRAHKTTRRVIECAIGVLKEKFPCLNYLRVDPMFACQVFNCCVTLCNFARNIINEDLDAIINEPDPNDSNVNIGQDLEEEVDMLAAEKFQRIQNYFRT